MKREIFNKFIITCFIITFISNFVFSQGIDPDYAKLLPKLYKNIFNLYGGIFKWVNQGYEIYNAIEKTIRIHGNTTRMEQMAETRKNYFIKF